MSPLTPALSPAGARGYAALTLTPHTEQSVAARAPLSCSGRGAGGEGKAFYALSHNSVFQSKIVKISSVTSPPTPDTGLPPDTLLHGGAYSTGAVLGQDGVCITDLDTDISQGRPVVIKEFFPPGYSRMGSHVLRDFDSSAALAQFLEEGHALVGLTQPGSASVLAVFEENNTAYIVTEFLAGKLPAQEAEVTEPLPEQETLVIVTEAPPVHQDIQPIVVVETQNEVLPVPSPDEPPPLFPPPVPPSDWLPVPEKSRHCHRCGSVNLKKALRCQACNVQLEKPLQPAPPQKIRTVYYVIAVILFIFLVLLALYLPAASPDV